jgi:murein DD-endopeptidase MepM/ murein hydrolase activator NlpD
VTTNFCRALASAVASAAVLCLAGPAQADGVPRIRGVECIQSCAGVTPRGGSLLLVSGSGMGDVYSAVFPGGRDGIRDLRGRAGQAAGSSVRVRVPWEASSGTFVVGTRTGMVSSPRPIRIAPVPVVSGWRCIGQCAAGRRPQPGSLLLVRGVRLAGVRDAVLQGGKGRADDQRARVNAQGFASFRMRVPVKAVTGNFAAREAHRRSPARRLVIQGPAVPTAPTVPAGGSGVFPVRGPHGFGSSGARFGAGRAGHVHQGQDVIAACGTPLVAAQAGIVRASTYQSAAGNYLVVHAATQDEVYMHLPVPSPLKEGAVVAQGQTIGSVGETGNAQGCHLHFELWSAPGWYEGGKPFDPLPQLQAWDAAG